MARAALDLVRHAAAARRMTRLEVWAPDGLPEVAAGDDLAALIADALTGDPPLADGDVVVVTSKVVSKAEGRVVTMDRDEAVTAETVRVVARRGPTRIVETRHGLCSPRPASTRAASTPGTVALLPVDPDASARAAARRGCSS